MTTEISEKGTMEKTEGREREIERKNSSLSELDYKKSRFWQRLSCSRRIVVIAESIHKMFGIELSEGVYW